MTGETHLALLLRSMQPELKTDIYVFCTLPIAAVEILNVNPVGIFYEAEGVTFIVSKSIAIAQNWPYTYECRQITLTIHSSLEAVGFLAAITQALARANISVNAISAYYHDHLFVPVNQAEQALICLRNLSAQVDVNGI